MRAYLTQLLWIKAIFFRILVIVVDFFIILLLVESAPRVAGITLMRHIVQTFLYFFHDYIWLRLGGNGTVRGIPTPILKTITFRIIAIGNDLGILYFFTREVGLSLELTLFITVANTIIYYFFEVGWQRLKKIKVRHSYSLKP